MKILLVTSGFPPHYSGVATATLNLAQQLSKKHQVAVLTTTTSKTSEVININPQFTVYKLSGIVLSKPRSVTMPYPYTKSVENIIKKFQPEIIHLQDVGPICLESFSVGKQINIPIVITHHFTAEFIIKTILPNGQLSQLLSNSSLIKKLIYSLVNLFYNYCSLVAVPNANLVPYFQQVDLKTPIMAIPNGIVTKNFRRRTQWQRVLARYNIRQPRVIINVSRLDPDKNLDILIDAFALIHPHNPDTCLVLVGDGSKKQQLQTQVKKLKLDQFVYFLGKMNNDHYDLSYIYNTSTLYASASMIENQSVAFIEAMAAGLPLVAVKTPISSITDNQGLQCLPNNAGALAVCLQKILSSHRLQKQISHFNRRYSRQFDISSTSQQYIKAYQLLLT